MFARIIDWSITNRLLIVLGALFIVAAGTLSLTRTPIDAVPDLSDVQVIIQTEYPGQAPRIVEDQVTYPLTTQMLSAPFAQVVRGYSFFGVSFVYVIFEDGTDPYWARSRVLEYLSSISGQLPPGVTPELGPDASGVGWAFMYALRSDRHDLGELRSIQDWFLKYELTAVPGVSEVASVGGFVRQYQVTVDPNRLRAFDLPISTIRTAIQESNSDVGGGLIEVAEKEFMIRGLGYIRSVDDIRRIGLGVGPDGTPILLQDVAQVSLGPESRRGLVEWNGEGETVGGIVVVRPGADTRRVIGDVRTRLDEVRPGLPGGVEIEVAYDRTPLIDRAVGSIRMSLFQQLLIVGVVCLIFLFHLRSGLVAVIALPIGILLAVIVVRLQGLTLNIMSLGGIAVAIGTMVDAGIVMVENAHRHLALNKDRKPHWQVIRNAATEVGPSLFFALLVITVSFMPVFTLEAQEGRLFRPLAFTKTYAMAAATLLSVTLVPVLVGYWVRGRIRPARNTPVGRFLLHGYWPVLGFVLKRPRWVIVGAVMGMLATVVPLSRLGSEFMPPLWEGDLLYMPTTLPGISITQAREILQQTDRIIYTFPEVRHVFGKVGRADSATDPAPLSMIETTIALKPRNEWRPGMTPERLVEELDAALRVPGLTNAWTMPIRGRIDMLATGIRTPVGIKISGPDLAELERLGQEVEVALQDVPGTASVYADRVMGGNYLDFTIDRDAIARHGLTVRNVQEVIQTAIGGMNVTTAVEGLERYPINLRYSRELRDDLPALRSVLVTAPDGHQVPLGRLATVEYVVGPSSIKSENAKPNAWVYIDIRDIDVGSYVEDAREVVAAQVALPAGYTLAWSGHYEYLERTQRRLAYVVPFTLLLIFVLIYLATRSVAETCLVALGVPFAVAGSFWLLHILDYDMSVAVWVGIIALAGLYAETAIVFLFYLNASLRDYRRGDLVTDIVNVRMDHEERPTASDRRGHNLPIDRTTLIQAIRTGAARRVRPVVMTIATDVLGLLPIMWSAGAGADVMKRIAAPLVGGVVTSGMVVLVVLPVAFYLWKARGLDKATLTSRL